MSESQVPKLIFSDEFDERAEFEAEQRGLIFYAVVELELGKKYEVCFFTPHRLALELSLSEEQGEYCFAEPGLIVISKITREYMERAVKFLYEREYFKQLIPIELKP